MSEISIRHASPYDVRTIGRLGARLVRLHHDFDAKRFLEAAQRLFARAGFRRTMIEMTRELDGSARMAPGQTSS